MKECRVCKKIKTENEFYTCNKGRQFHTSCKDCFKAKTLEQYKNNRVERLIKMRSYNIKNKDHVRKLQREHNTRKYYSDPQFRLTRVLRARLSAALKNNYKSGSAIKDLGCSVTEFKIYLESKFLVGMSWSNYGQWHIDHKIALANFDLTDRKQFCKAVHFTNLQPLWAKENQSKGAK